MPGTITSPPSLLITEIGNSDYYTWLEIYNATNHSIDLRDYVLRCYAANSMDRFARIMDFDLPSKVISAGEFMLLRGDPDNNRSNSAGIVYINQVENGVVSYPYVDSMGGGGVYFELILKGQTIDFVKIGFNVSPLTGSFVGDAPFFNNWH